jgi:hypothetical protein
MKALPDNTVEASKNYTVKFQTLSADPGFNLIIDQVAVLDVEVTDIDSADVTITRGLKYTTTRKARHTLLSTS